MNRRITFRFLLVVIFLPFLTIEAFGGSAGVWQQQWPDTDFSKSTVDLNEIQPDGPGKDGIPAIDHPKFVPVTESSDLAGEEPVIGLVLGMWRRLILCAF